MYNKILYSSRPYYPAKNPGSVTLYLWYKDLFVYVLSADLQRILYNITLDYKTPQIILNFADTKAIVGTVAFHSWSTTIDAVVNEAPIKMTKPNPLFNDKYKWKSPAQKNARFAWKQMGSVCENEQGVHVALLSYSTQNKTARFDFYGTEVIPKAFIEEVLVTGVALKEQWYGIRECAPGT